MFIDYNKGKHKLGVYSCIVATFWKMYKFQARRCFLYISINDITNFFALYQSM